MKDSYQIEVIYISEREAYLVSATESDSLDPHTRLEFCLLGEIIETINLVEESIKIVLGVT